MDMASRLGKVQMSMWLFAASLPLLASKTAIGVAFPSSSVFRDMGFKMLEIKICVGCTLCVFEVFLRF